MNPRRTSIALDEETNAIFDKLTEQGSSQSDVIRKALKLYYSLRDFREQDIEKMRFYHYMLSKGEHVILDLDHLVALLKVVEGGEGREDFSEKHRQIARDHAEEFRSMSVDQILKRLESCNFYRLVESGNEYTLVFGSDEVKQFMKVFLNEILGSIHKEAEIKEHLTKLKIAVK